FVRARRCMTHARYPIRLGARHKLTLYAVFFALWGSGALWLLFHYFLRVPGDFGDAAHPLELWWLRLHGLMAFASLVAIGSVLPIHARQAWQLGKNRRSGLAMKAYLLLLAATGYALYYFTSEANEAWLPLSHWVAGLALPLVALIHIRLGRRGTASAARSI
ncbi:MAG: hypothetical protein OEL91_05175, partial [Burkholderiaceae bacterium]|nr:hypothetical protein [Burkholderiaceae bacterium]